MRYFGWYIENMKAPLHGRCGTRHWASQECMGTVAPRGKTGAERVTVAPEREVELYGEVPRGATTLRPATWRTKSWCQRCRAQHFGSCESYQQWALKSGA